MVCYWSRKEVNLTLLRYITGLVKKGISNDTVWVGESWDKYTDMLRATNHSPTKGSIILTEESVIEMFLWDWVFFKASSFPTGNIGAFFFRFYFWFYRFFFIFEVLWINEKRKSVWTTFGYLERFKGLIFYDKFWQML